MTQRRCIEPGDELERVIDRQPTLESDLILLRPLQEADFPALLEIASDPLVWEQRPSNDRTDPTVFRLVFDNTLASGGALAVVDCRDGRVIGTSRFDRYDPVRSEVEIGWTVLARSHWGGVYNGEMKRLMLGHASRFVSAVVFRVHSQNFRSQRAVERLGAVRTGSEVVADGQGETYVFHLLFSAPEVD